MILALIAKAALGWQLLGPGGVPTGASVDPASMVREEPTGWSGALVQTPSEELARAAERALARLSDWPAGAPAPNGMLAALGVSEGDLRQTLAWIVRVHQEDQGTEEDRLRDPAFLEANLRYLRWEPDRTDAARRGISLETDELRLTRYLVWSVAGSPVRTERAPAALYQLPDQELGLTEDQAAALPDLLRSRLTRQQVLAGAFLAGGSCEGRAQPLVWMREEDVHQALLQGTVRVDLPGGRHRFYTVHRSNGIAWDPSVRPHTAQARYWYFHETDGPRGWGPAGLTGAALVPGVSVAGDVFNLGYGLLISLERDGVRRLVVLEDTGGAFQPNLFQLDLYTGVFRTQADFARATAAVPARPHAGILVLRQTAPPADADRVE